MVLMRVPALLVATMLVSVVGAGCLDSGSPVETPTAAVPATLSLTDPPGDAPPFIDVQSGRLVETPSGLRVELTVGAIDPAKIPSQLAAARTEWAKVGICWNPGEYGNDQCAGLMMTTSPTRPVFGYFENFAGPESNCNDWYWCSYALPYELDGVGPTTILLTVPRELMANGSVGAILRQPSLEGVFYHGSATDPFYAGKRRVIVGACAVVTCAGRVLGYSLAAQRDQGTVGSDLVLALQPQLELGRPSPKTILVDGARDVESPGLGYRPELDILSVDVEETESEFAYVVKVASLPVAPTHGFDMEAGLDGIAYEAWYEMAGGQVRNAMGGHCADVDCSVWKQYPVSVRFTPGTPGTIRVGIRWSDMEGPRAGTLLTLAEAEMGDMGVGHHQSVGLARAWAYVTGTWDSAWHAEPYYLVRGGAK